MVGVAELARLLKRNPKDPVRRLTLPDYKAPGGLFYADQAVAEWEAATLHERGHDNRSNVLETAPANDLPRKQQA